MLVLFAGALTTLATSPAMWGQRSAAELTFAPKDKALTVLLDAGKASLDKGKLTLSVALSGPDVERSLKETGAWSITSNDSKKNAAPLSFEAEEIDGKKVFIASAVFQPSPTCQKEVCRLNLKISRSEAASAPIAVVVEAELGGSGQPDPPAKTFKLVTEPQK